MKIVPSEVQRLKIIVGNNGWEGAVSGGLTLPETATLPVNETKLIC